MTEKHIQTVKDLIIRYRSLTEEEITGVMQTKGCEVFEVLRILTGFGAIDSCSLCKNIKEEYNRLACEHCIWGDADYTDGRYPCTQRGRGDTYCLVRESNTVQQLLYSVRARAKLMELILEEEILEEEIE